MKRSGKGIGSSCFRFEKVAEHRAIPGVPRLQASESAKLLASPSGLEQAKSVPSHDAAEGWHKCRRRPQEDGPTVGVVCVCFARGVLWSEVVSRVACCASVA